MNKTPLLEKTGDAGRVQRLDAAGPGRVHRQDAGELLRAVHTGEGFLLMEATVAKPGVLRYVRADGSVTREFIPPDELLRQDSIGTLGRVPVTLEHPPEDVTPENVQQYGVGDLDSFVDASQQGGFVKVRMAVRRSDALAAIKAGTREVSPGYSCRIDATPGVDPVYGAYDAIQRDRIYNHVAITKQARGGRELCLRFDSAVEALPEKRNMIPKVLLLLAKLNIKPRRADAAGTGTPTPTESDIDQAIARIGDMQAKLAEALPAAKNEADLKAQVAALTASLAKTNAQLKAAQSVINQTPLDIVEAGEADPVDPLTDPAALQDPKLAPQAAPVQQAPGFVPPMPAQLRTDSIRKAVLRVGAERAKLESVAGNLRMDSATVAKMGNRSLRKALVLKALPSAKKDGDPAYYKAAVDVLASGRRTDSAGAIAGPPNPYEGIEEAYAKRADSASADKAEAAPVTILDTIDAGFKARHQARG